jgi:hypothetical protein
MTTSNELQTLALFPSLVYTINKAELIPSLAEIAKDSLQLALDAGSAGDLCKMSVNMIDDPRTLPFAQYVIDTAKNILDSQGYDLSQHDIGVSSIWLQEHDQHSTMPQHIHGGGIQLVGFFFIDVDDEGCRLLFHDPRASKVITDLPEKNKNQVNQCTSEIFIQPIAGDLVFTNSFLPHSLTRNKSEKQTRFLHINIVALPRIAQNTFQCIKPEVI